MRFQPATAEEPEINLTALIDVVFLLLIFFMVSTTFDRQQALPITLPDASQGAPSVESATFEIVLGPDGMLSTSGWSGPVDDSQWLNVVREWQTTSPQGTVIVYADTQARHGEVVGVLDQLANAEVQSVQVATRYNQD